MKPDTTQAPVPLAPTLSTAQQAAVAKLSYAIDTAGAVAVLCGPAGVGKSLVLASLARSPTLRGRAVHVMSPATGYDLPAATGTSPDVVLIDDAHRMTDHELAGLVASCRTSQAGIVLAGEGRLLTLLSRDQSLERLVRLRVALPPFSRDETRLLVAARTGAAAPLGDDDGVATTIHEITGGIPARIVQLADLARVVVDSRPGTALTRHDIEAIHERLAINAA